jgi:sulfate adenylyltransferase
LPDIKAHASTLPSIQVSERVACDLELLATGAFSPLDRFMGQADYQRVLDEMRLADGVLFPLPITLPVDPARQSSVGKDIALRNAKNELLAVLTVEEIYEWDKEEVRAEGLRLDRHAPSPRRGDGALGQLNISRQAQGAATADPL